MDDQTTKIFVPMIHTITSDNMHVTVNNETGHISITPSKPLKKDDNDIKYIIDEDIKE